MGQITANFPKQNNITTNYLDKYKRRTQIVRFAASDNKTDHLGPPASRHMAKKTLGKIALHLEPSEPASTQSKYQGTTTIGVSVKKNNMENILLPWKIIYIDLLTKLFCSIENIKIQILHPWANIYIVLRVFDNYILHQEILPHPHMVS